ncbi:MAG: META domain-containing protein [Moheibacter sp.]
MNTDETTFWVAGYKVETPNGAGFSENFIINKSTDYTQGNWEFFYTSIDGFVFEDGIMKQIQVKQTILDKSQVPADASTIQYTLIKEIHKVQDNRSLLNDNWVLTKINGKPIDEKIELPTLKIDLAKMQATGNDGCNRYFGGITKLTHSEIEFAKMGSTKMACIKEDVAYIYYQMLQSATQFEVSENQLELLDSRGNSIGLFIKEETM